MDTIPFRRALTLLTAGLLVAALLVPVVATEVGAAAPKACRVKNLKTGKVTKNLAKAVRLARKGHRLTVRGTCHGRTYVGKSLSVKGVRVKGSGRPTLDADDKGRVLTIKAGVGYTDESLGGASTSGPTGLWEMEFRYQFGGGRLEFVHDHQLAYQNYGANNTILRSNTGLRMDVLWDIYATATYRFNYETEPAPGKLSNDSTLAFGLGAKF